MVTFNANDPLETVRAHAKQEKTMLMAFFELNRNNPFAHDYTYQELLLHFIWECQKKQWKSRQCGGMIGCMYFVSPTAGKRFYVCTLLTSIKGPTSWDNMCTFEGIQHHTFHAACLAQGLLENNDKW